jgi:hypothetical protein
MGRILAQESSSDKPPVIHSRCQPPNDQTMTHLYEWPTVWCPPLFGRRNRHVLKHRHITQKSSPQELASQLLPRWPTPQCIPVDIVIKALAEIMRSNIFQLGDTFWKQSRGCGVMGPSATVNYTYIYVGLLKAKRLIPCYKTCLLLFK